MSRIGKKPIIFDNTVKITKKDKVINVNGPKGELNMVLPSGVDVVINNNNIEVKLDDKQGSNSKQGLFRSLLQNAIIGVKEQWSKTLEIIGVGFRAETNGSELTLFVGYSHPVKIKAPAGITFQVAENKITVLGVDKYLVGEVAASIRRIKKPDPYKGKGIRYLGEYIRKKAGKAVKTAGAAATK